MDMQKHRNLKTAHQIRSIGCLREKAVVESAGMDRAKYWITLFTKELGHDFVGESHCYVDWGLLLAFEGAMYGGDMHSIQLDSAWYSPATGESSCQYASKTSLQSMPHAQPQKHWALFKSCLPSSKAHLHKLALITLCCSAPSLPGTLLGYLHDLFERQDQQ